LLPTAVLIRTVAPAYLLLVAFIAPTSSWAYRPFIATDAAVADPKEVEIELGYFTLERENNENAFVIPRVVFNYGLFQNWEAVAEFDWASSGRIVMWSGSGA